jgi:hypothetical protein
MEWLDLAVEQRLIFYRYVVVIIPNVASIATTPKIAIVVVVLLLLNWIITFTTRQDKTKILYYNNHIYDF